MSLFMKFYLGEHPLAAIAMGDLQRREPRNLSLPNINVNELTAGTVTA